MIASSLRAAVLTGDLVLSTASSTAKVNSGIDRFLSLADTLSTWPGNDYGFFTRFRGDGWQLLIPRAALSLRAMICAHATLRAEGDLPLSRISLGFGSVEQISGRDLSAATGSAFVASGRALDTLEKARLFSVAGDGVTPLHHAVIALVEDHVLRWTPEQAEATLWFLSPENPTQKSIAETLHISTQAVHARLKGAGAHALRRAVEAWEEEESRHD